MNSAAAYSIKLFGQPNKTLVAKMSRGKLGGWGGNFPESGKNRRGEDERDIILRTERSAHAPLQLGEWTPRQSSLSCGCYLGPRGDP